MAYALPQRPKERLPVVYTSRARCRDCYRCVRVCPVNAIRMHEGQAQVIPERCIACGTCILNCPQHAKEYRSDYGRVLQMIEDGETLAISIAPAFASYYSGWERERLPSALRMLGFSYVGETAIGAWHTAMATRKYIEENPGQSYICTACPAVVNYIVHEKHTAIPAMVPVVSPVVAHARMLKEQLPQRKVVFAGPCVAKKDEANWEKNSPFLDVVITFEELDELFRLKNISISNCEASNFNEQPPGQARLFPLEGGLLRTAGLSTDMLDDKVLAVSGYREVKEAIEMLQDGNSAGVIIEPLFCKNGCINGPYASKSANSIRNRCELMHYAGSKPGKDDTSEQLYSKTNVRLPEAKKKKIHNWTAEQITEVLKLTGKHQQADELNCTACGYPSCRDKAVAVLEGLAEPEMCMPYMRRSAESKYDTMIACDPNGIVLLSHDLQIIHMNLAFKKMFSCSDALSGKKISYLIDPDVFEQLATGHETVVRQVCHYPSYHLICHLVAYSLPGEENYVGVFVDITDSQSSKDKLAEVKQETVVRAHELIEHQINMAQELARFLGENTARGEILMKTLIESIRK